LNVEVVEIVEGEGEFNYERRERDAKRECVDEMMKTKKEK